MTELTILLPCLNEARALPFCIREARAFLEETGVEGEILLADNGSTDGSQALAEQLGARVVPISQRGYGSALRGGQRPHLRAVRDGLRHLSVLLRYAFKRSSSIQTPGA